MGDVLFRSANAMGAELLNLKNPSLAITVAGVLQEGEWWTDERRVSEVF